MAACTQHIRPENRSYLSLTEIDCFLSEKLGIDLKKEAPLSEEILQKISWKFVQVVPYSILRYLSVPMERRRLSTIEEVREIGLNLKGGMCYETNVFFSWILLGLGYELSYCLGGVFSPPGQPNHTLVIVHHKTAICL